MNKKKKEDNYLISENRRAKVEVASYKDAFSIIWSHWPNFLFFKTSINICRDDYIRKNGDNANINIVDGRAENLDTNTIDVNENRRVNNIGTMNIDEDAKTDNISITDIDKNKKTDNTNISIVDIGRRVNNMSTVDINGDRRANNSSIGTIDINKVDNPYIGIVDANREKGADDLNPSATDTDRTKNSGIDIVDVNGNNNLCISKQLDKQVNISKTACTSLIFFI